jgi:hypothetical protein
MLQYFWMKLYSRWLREQLLRRPPPVSFRHGSGRNLILGIGRNYSIADLRPFVRSARRHHNCRILMVINNDSELGKALDAEGVDYLLDDGWSGLGQPHMNFARVADYIAVLQGLNNQVDRVFLADTRDVVFQRDIFQSQPDAPVVFFEESQGFSLDVAGWNGNAVRRTFGNEIYERIKHHEVICSGTVLCRYDDAIMYCWEKLLLAQMVQRRHHMRPGLDQATTNVVARLNLVPGSIVQPYDRVVATLSGPNNKFMTISKVDQLLVTTTGNVPAAVHQYDRVPEIRDFVYAAYDGPKGVRAGDKSKRRTFGKQLREIFGL